MGVKDYVLKLCKGKSGKTLSLYHNSGKVMGAARIDKIRLILRGESKSVAIRHVDSRGHWNTVGWINLTMKKEVFRINDMKGKYLGGINSQQLKSLIKNNHDWYIYPSKKKGSKSC